MKSYRNAVILIVILGLLFGAYMYISKKKGNDSTDKSANSEGIKILEIDKDKISEISIENKGEKLVFTKKDKDWTLTLPSNVKFDKSKIENIAESIAALSAEKVIEENASDLGQYGLNSPATLSLKMADGTAKAIEFGAQTPTKESYYIKFKDSNKVYTINSYTAETFIITKNDIRDRVLFSVKPEDIIGFSMDRANSLVFSAKKHGNSNWDLTEPIEASADISKFDPIFKSVLQLNVVSYIEDNAPDLSKYGLNSPAYALEVETSSGKTKVILGDEKEKNKEIYAKLEGSNEVFTLDESPLNFIDKPLKEILDPFAYIVNISDVNKVVVEMDGRTDTAEITTDKDKKDNDKFIMNGTDLSGIKVGDKYGDGLFRVYYQNLIGITMSELEIGAKPSGKADITFTYFLKTDPGKMKVEFISKDNKYYYVVKNGKYSNIIVDKAQFDHLRQTYKDLMDAIATKK